ncbi:MAG: hypothetical protein AVDCRST_MAG22-3679 [uncultured Rubrobacteraceae bacterium]|uniref:N-acetyltransferase domain-containing protein n=1 Tax=uncultured Rubrobacteraceae bacterium TaxID=349277 RepID=A0A6J4QF59_9ACTN|nr:MAG: hypothetical protein AVDCRST_MAG22-3679 [uncultured Rubrobacteraceae bacterium]
MLCARSGKPSKRVARTTWDHTYRDTIPEEVRTRFVRRAYSDESLLQRIANDVFLVAVRDDEVFGFADFLPGPEGTAELAAVYVLPEAQGQGLGSRLLDTGLCRFPPGTRFVLNVERANTKARRFYKARGFRPVRELVDVYLGHELHDVEMLLEPRR